MLHEFVIMPDHIHVIFTPVSSLEKTVQFIKGGFSYRVKKELGSNMEVWQKGFSDHRIRDAGDYLVHVAYVRGNPVRKHLCDRQEDYLNSSANGRFHLDPIPQGLKPESFVDLYGAPEGAPLQSLASGAAVGTTVQDSGHSAAESAPPQSKPVASDKTATTQSKDKIA